MPTVTYDHQIFSHQEFGGVSRYFCELASRVPENPGWRAKVVAPLHYNRYLKQAEVPTVGFYLPLATPRLGRLYAEFDDIVSPMLSMFSTSDVVHQTYYGARPRNGSRPFVITVFDMIHELFPGYFSASDPVPRLKKALVKTADHVICISAKTASDLVNVLGVAPEKISVTHLAHSGAFVAPPESPDAQRGGGGRPYLLYVGKRGGYKNFARVVEAYASSMQLRGHFDLLAFGGGAFTISEKARFSELGLEPDGVRHQAGDDHALARCYAGARVFIYPSEYEGFGIPPLEAMACGCAVVCSFSSSIPEVVGAAGEYFDPTDVDSIRSALETTALGDSRHAALCAAGREQCRQFSWSRCARETLAVYENVLRGRASG